MTTEIILRPIGIYMAQGYLAEEPYQVPRQADCSDRRGSVELEKGRDFETALKDLSGFTRIWLIYHFHENQNWKPLVLPPRGTDSKKGVFATRAPYRPNPVGLSCVRVTEISGLKIVVVGADLLSGTPILDIKPYLPEVDSFPDSAVGWLNDIEKKRFVVIWSEAAQAAKLWFAEHKLGELVDFSNRQLEYEPCDDRRKRVSKNGDQWILAYRTWRIHFELKAEQIWILSVSSGYSAQDQADPSDPYNDKALHREFEKLFPAKT